MTALRYAATTVDITPPTKVPLGGYAARGPQPAVGTHDRLTASLLWLTGERDSVCWVAVDALSLDSDTAARIRTAVADHIGLHQDAVLVCSSHTHSGPATWLRPLRGMPSAVDTAAIDRLIKDISRGARRLPTIRTTVTPGWHTAHNVGVGANRYDPTGPHDDSTGVLTLRDAENAVVAVLFDYA
ncbi:MAG TPA: hypothetical protein VF892_14100, partial [Pseudonocardiaceae bacterium]